MYFSAVKVFTCLKCVAVMETTDTARYKGDESGAIALPPSSVRPALILALGCTERRSHALDVRKDESGSYNNELIFSITN